jgi:hypothetical protein
MTTDQRTRKKLAKHGFIVGKNGFEYTADPLKVADYLNSVMLRTPLPNRKRLKLSDF